MNDFQVTINSDSFDRSLNSLHSWLADESAPLKAVAGDLREMIAEQFASEGAAGGTPWAPLADSTLRKNRGTRRGILNMTGALLGSLVEAGAPGHVEESDGQQLIFGSALPYANFHQTGAGLGLGQAQLGGATRKSRKSAGPGRGGALPMRPLIVVTDDRTQKWADMFRAQFDAASSVLGARELGG